MKKQDQYTPKESKDEFLKRIAAGEQLVGLEDVPALQSKSQSLVSMMARGGRIPSVRKGWRRLTLESMANEALAKVDADSKIDPVLLEAIARVARIPGESHTKKMAKIMIITNSMTKKLLDLLKNNHPLVPVKDIDCLKFIPTITRMRLFENGELPGIKIGRIWYTDKAIVLQAISDMQPQKPPKAPPRLIPKRNDPAQIGAIVRLANQGIYIPGSGLSKPPK